jgi:hypothetical protein
MQPLMVDPTPPVRRSLPAVGFALVASVGAALLVVVAFRAPLSGSRSLHIRTHQSAAPSTLRLRHQPALLSRKPRGSMTLGSLPTPAGRFDEDAPPPSYGVAGGPVVFVAMAAMASVAGLWTASSRILSPFHSLASASTMDAGAEAESKMVPIDEIEAFGPSGVLVAGMGQDQAALVREIAGEALATETPPPLVWLRSEDDTQTLETVLAELQERADQVPAAPFEVARPFVLFSGFTPTQVQEAVNLMARSGIPIPMMAMAVPRAMAKPMRRLVSEIQSDFESTILEPMPEMLG